MDENLEKTLRNMEQPTVNVSSHQKEFRLTILNTKRSAIAGTLFLLLPFLFLTGVIFKHYLQMDLSLFTSVYEWIGEVDRKYGDNSILNWVIRILLLFGPLIAIGLNLLSILHVRYERSSKEIITSIKLKWLNLSIILGCGLIFAIFFLYLVVENAGS